MSQTVFILGAGASKDAGAPLMAEFLDTARELYRKNLVTESEDHFKRVFKAISVLQQVHSKAILDFGNVESVFATFEMAEIIQKFSDYSPEEIRALQKSMKIVIARTIEKTLKFKIGTEGSLSVPSVDYYRLIILLSKLSDLVPSQTFSVITFNYDLALDFTFEVFGPVFYGLDGETKMDKSATLLKLHGSLNWGVCCACNKTDAIRNLSKMWATHPGKNALIELSPKLKETLHCCGSSFQPEPVLIPPSFSKSEYQKSLTSVWKEAAKELKDAEDIFVIGYSMPESDYFFRNLFALGTVGETLIRRFWVFDPDNTGNVEQRFRTLLGPGAAQRFEYFEEKFGSAIQSIGKAYGIELSGPHSPGSYGIYI